MTTLNYWEKISDRGNVDEMKKKEQIYKEFCEKEVKMVLDLVVEKDKEKNNYLQNYRIDSDDNDLEDDIYENKFFE